MLVPSFTLFVFWALLFQDTKYVDAQTEVEKRPLYNIAHMANTIREVNYYLNRGANAVEADVTFSAEGEPQLMYHGSPCHCFRLCSEREDIGAYLKYIREITRPASPRYRKDLSLLFLDLKVSHLPGHSKFRAGDLLADILVNGLWKNGTNDSYVSVVLSVGHTADSPVIAGFRETLLKRDMTHLEDKIGWDIGLNDPIGEINRLWKSLGVGTRRWQGDGSSNCLGQMSGARLRSVIRARDQNGTFDKVYKWTVDLSTGIRHALRNGVDGIVTNHPERVNLILSEPEFERRYRLANVMDDPWERVQVQEILKKKPQNSFSSSLVWGQPPLFAWAGNIMELVSSLGSFIGDSVRWYFRSDEWAKAEVAGAF